MHASTDQDKTLGQMCALTGQEERQVPDQVLGSLFRLWLEQPQLEVVVNVDHRRRYRVAVSIQVAATDSLIFFQ